MNDYEIKNAIIESAVLDIGDRGLLQGWIYLDYGGAGQGFGGYALHLPGDWKNHETYSPYAGEWIMRVMQVAGVGKWDQLKGKTIRVKANHCGVSSIGHIVKDDWFTPDEDFKKLKALDVAGLDKERGER